MTIDDQNYTEKNIFPEIWNEIISIYEFFIDDLAKVYNQKFNCKFEKRFYEIIIGPWLINLISIIVSIKISKYDMIPNIDSAEKIIIPSNYSAYVRLLSNYRYLAFLKQNLISENFENRLEQVEVFSLVQNKSNLKRYIYNIFEILSRNLYGEKRVHLIEPYFSYNHIYKILYIIFKSKFKIIEISDQLKDIKIDTKIDVNLRNNLEFNSSNSNDLISRLAKLLPFCIPVDYLENFQSIINQVKNKTPVKLYYTANIRAVSTPMQYLLGLNVNFSRSKIIIHQHGGGYGIQKNLLAQFLDDRQSDIFLTWGWFDKNPKFLPFVSTKLFRNYISSRKKLNRVGLVIGTGHKNFNLYQPYSGKLRLNAIEKNKLFMQSTAGLFHLVIRTIKNENHGWNELEELSNFSKTLKSKISFQIDGTFNKYLDGIDLVILDYLGTTFYESLSRNIPTIIYLDNDISIFTEDSREIIDALRAVGIIQNSVETTISFLNDLVEIGSLDAWWNSFELKIAKDKFLNVYANYRSSWKDDLISLLENYII